MYHVDTSGKIISSFVLPFYDDFWGWPFAFDGKYLWVCNNQKGQILKMDTSGNTLYSFYFDYTTSHIFSLACDGEYLWVLESEGHKISKIDTTGKLIDSMRTPGLNAQSITFYGEYLWVGDYLNIYKMDLSGNVVFVLYYPEGRYAALAHDGKYLWADVCTDNESRIYRLDADRQTGTYEHFRWAFHTGGFVDSSPAIGSDGTIYVGAIDGNVYALNPNSTVKWAFNIGVAIKASPAIGPDGTIYIQAGDDFYYALSPDGKEKWRFEVGGSVSTCLAIGKDGTVYATTYDIKLYALNPDGTVKWGLTGPEFTGLAIGADETLYGVTTGGYVYALTPEGNIKWRVLTGGRPEFPPAIGADGTIYVLEGFRDGSLYAISSCGWLKWRLPLKGQVYSAPVIGEDGTIYVGMNSPGNMLYAINPYGTEKWSIEIGPIKSTPAVGKDGTIFVGISDINDRIAARKPTGELKWFFFTGATIYSSPVIGVDGTVYVGSGDGNLYAIKTDCGGLAESSWPMYQQNPLHTGRVEAGPIPACSMCPAETLLGDDTEKLNSLRALRDNVLAKSVFGKKVIETYYSNADRVNLLLDNHPVIRETAKKALELAVLVMNKIIRHTEAF